jgi:hypothetical protein
MPVSVCISGWWISIHTYIPILTITSLHYNKIYASFRLIYKRWLPANESIFSVCLNICLIVNSGFKVLCNWQKHRLVSALVVETSSVLHSIVGVKESKRQDSTRCNDMYSPIYSNLSAINWQILTTIRTLWN